MTRGRLRFLSQFRTLATSVWNGPSFASIPGVRIANRTRRGTQRRSEVARRCCRSCVGNRVQDPTVEAIPWLKASIEQQGGRAMSLGNVSGLNAVDDGK